MKEKKANTGSLISIAVAILIVTTVFIAQASTVTVNSKDLDKDFSQSLEANVPEGFSIAFIKPRICWLAQWDKKC